MTFEIRFSNSYTHDVVLKPHSITVETKYKEFLYKGLKASVIFIYWDYPPSTSDSDEMLIPSKTKTRTGQFFNEASLELESQLKPQTKLKQQFRPCGILRHAPEVEKLQIRRCWSDIWPFPGDTDSCKQAEDDQDASNFGVTRNKSRITPFYPLNRSPAFKSSESTTFSCESLTSNQSNYASSPDDVLMLQRPLQVGIKNGKVKVPSPKDHDRYVIMVLNPSS